MKMPAFSFLNRVFGSLVLAATLAACVHGADMAPQEASDQAEVAPNFQLVTDIPIPPDAKLDNERSLILSNNDRWTGRVVLKLSQAAHEASAFFQQQMPSFGWEKVMSVQGPSAVLTYVRGGRAATVQIDKGSLFGSVAAITVAPRESGEAPMGASPSRPPAARAPEPVRAQPPAPPR